LDLGQFSDFLPRIKKSNSQETFLTFPNDIFEKSAVGESKSAENFPIALGIPSRFSAIFGDFL